MPGRPTCPVISASAIRQRALSVPCTCCEMPMPHRIIEPRDVAYRRATSRMTRRGNAAHGRHRFRTVVRDVLANLLVTARAVGDELCRDQAFLDDGVHHRVEHGHVGVGLELQIVRRMARELGTARVGENKLGAGLDRILDPRRRHRVIDDRIGADQQHDFGLHHVHDRIRHRARADAFQQCRDARRMAQARAVIDVVRAETGADELLEQVRLLVRTLGRAEAGERAAAMRIADALQRAAGERQRLLPCRFAEHRQRIGRVHDEIRRLRHAGLADQRLGEALPVMHVIEAVSDPLRTGARGSPARRVRRRERCGCP